MICRCARSCWKSSFVSVFQWLFSIVCKYTIVSSGHSGCLPWRMFLAPTTGLNCLWEAHATVRAFIYYRRPIKLFRKKRDRQRDPIVYLNNFCCNGNGRKLMLIGLRIFVSNHSEKVLFYINNNSKIYFPTRICGKVHFFAFECERSTFATAVSWGKVSFSTLVR